MSTILRQLEKIAEEKRRLRAFAESMCHGAHYHSQVADLTAKEAIMHQSRALQRATLAQYASSHRNTWIVVPCEYLCTDGASYLDLATTFIHADVTPVEILCRLEWGHGKYYARYGDNCQFRGIPEGASWINLPLGDDFAQGSIVPWRFVKRPVAVHTSTDVIPAIAVRASAGTHLIQILA